MSESDEKQRIVDVASQRFFEQGISKVTLDELASDLGMSKKTMYKFFPSKDDLLKTIVYSMMATISGRVEKIVSSPNPFADKASDLMELIGRQLGTISKQFMIDLQRFSPALWNEVEEFRRERILTNFRRIFEQGKEEGAFRKDLDVELFMMVFLSSVQGIVNPRVLAQQAFSTEQALHGIFKIIFEGAMTEDARLRIRMVPTSATTLS